MQKLKQILFLISREPVVETELYLQACTNNKLAKFLINFDFSFQTHPTRGHGAPTPHLRHKVIYLQLF